MSQAAMVANDADDFRRSAIADAHVRVERLVTVCDANLAAFGRRGACAVEVLRLRAASLQSTFESPEMPRGGVLLREEVIAMHGVFVDAFDALTESLGAMPAAFVGQVAALHAWIGTIREHLAN